MDGMRNSYGDAELVMFQGGHRSSRRATSGAEETAERLPLPGFSEAGLSGGPDALFFHPRKCKLSWQRRAASHRVLRHYQLCRCRKWNKCVSRL